MSTQSAKHARILFGEMVSRGDEKIKLAEAALLIAAEEYPRLDVAAYLEKLDHFADLARDRAEGARDAADMITAINSTLFEDLGFHGNRESYSDPRNSFLNEVIDRRTGIPIALTIVYIEVGRGLGFPIKGVGMPFHFIAKHEAESGDIFIDPFNEGRLLGEAGCSELLAKNSSGKIELLPAHLDAVTNKQILTRMLSNLLGIYAASDHRRALSAVERILLIDPHSTTHIRDRGLLLASVGDTSSAISELKRYLELAPGAADANSIREHLKSIRQNQAKLN